METPGDKIIVPTMKNIDELQDKNDGERLVGHYSFAERLGAAYREQATHLRAADNDDVARNVYRRRIELTAAYHANASQFNKGLTYDWQGRDLHVEALDEQATPIQTWREPTVFFRNAPATLMGAQSAAEGRLHPESLQGEEGLLRRVKPLWLEGWHLLRRTLMHEVQVVEPDTGNPLVHIDFLDK